MRLRTARLELVPSTLPFADAVRHDRRLAERLLGASLPEGWPSADLARILGLLAPEPGADDAALGFGVWLVVDPAARRLVGDAGFLGAPSGGEVELGFSVVPEHRNLGYATEAAAALARWASSQPGVSRVVARTEPDNAASARVLEKAGFRRSGRAAGLVVWRFRAGA